MSEAVDNNGFTASDMNDLLIQMETEGSACTFNGYEIELLMDALSMYKGNIF